MNYFPAFTSGLQYAANPFAIVTTLLFLILLGDRGTTLKKTVIIGIFFIFASFLTVILLSFGTADIFFQQLLFQKTIQGFYFCISIFFIVLGFLHLNDWMNYKKTGDIKGFLLKGSFVCKKEEKSKIKLRYLFFLISSAFFSGSVLTLLSFIWPQDEYVFILFSFLMSGQDWKLAMLSFVVYGIAFVLPMLIVWIVFMGLRFNQRVCECMQQKISSIKIMASAIFLSIGVGTIFIISKMLKV